MKNFEKLAYGMGLNKGMFAINIKNGQYISPITRQLLDAYKEGKMNALLVNSLVENLK